MRGWRGHKWPPRPLPAALRDGSSLRSVDRTAGREGPENTFLLGLVKKKNINF